MPGAERGQSYWEEKKLKGKVGCNESKIWNSVSRIEFKIGKGVKSNKRHQK